MSKDHDSIANLEQRRTFDRLTELRNAADHFLEGYHWADHFHNGAELAAYKLAHVLRSCEDDTIQGFPRIARQPARDLKTLFSQIIVRWGWEDAIGPDGERVIEEHTRRALGRRDAFYETVLSFVEGLAARGREIPDDLERLAQYAEDELKLTPKVPFDEAETYPEERRRKYFKTPLIGEAWPDWEEAETEKFREKKGKIADALAALRRKLNIPIEGPFRREDNPISTPDRLIDVSDEGKNNDSIDLSSYVTFKEARMSTGLKPYKITRLCTQNKVRSIGRGKGLHGRRVHSADSTRYVNSNQKIFD